MAVIDVYRRLVRTEPDPRRELWVSRVIAVGMSAALVGIAMAFAKASDSLLNEGLAVLTYAYGSVLGVFFIGRVTRGRGSDPGNLAAMVAGIYAVLSLKFNTLLFPALPFRDAAALPALFARSIAWTWYIVVGFTVTVAIGVLFASDPEKAKSESLNHK